MLGYYGGVNISDGQESRFIQMAGNIIVNGKNSKMIIETDQHHIRGHKFFVNGSLAEHERLGEFHRCYKTMSGEQIKAPVVFSYHPDTKRSLHGWCLRSDQKLFGRVGTCRTKYARGRFMAQEFRYSNRKLAFKLKRFSREVTILYPSGKKAASISCPGGFSTSSRSEDGYAWNGNIHGSYRGEVYFKIDEKLAKKGRRMPDWAEDESEFAHKKNADNFDFSKDGNCKFEFYDRFGNIYHKGQYENHQRVGDWILSGRRVFFLNGVPVDRKLWETPPEKLNPLKILKIKNAQLRAALLKKIGSERVFKECKHKVIHKTKDMMLVEFPVNVDDGNGSNNSRMRILQVVCPTTKNKYYLNVPDFVWDSGKKTKLDTCEQARQWTFGNDDPRKTIKFSKET